MNCHGKLHSKFSCTQEYFIPDNKACLIVQKHNYFNHKTVKNINWSVNIIPARIINQIRNAAGEPRPSLLLIFHLARRFCDLSQGPLKIGNWGGGAYSYIRVHIL